MTNDDQQKRGYTTMDNKVFINKQEALEVTGVKATTLKLWRLGDKTTPPRLVEDVHWIRLNGRWVLYNRELLIDFVVNFNHPERHQRVVEAFLAKLPSSKVVA